MTISEARETLRATIGGLDDGHGRWPVPELADVLDYLEDLNITQDVGQHPYDPYVLNGFPRHGICGANGCGASRSNPIHYV